MHVNTNVRHWKMTEDMFKIATSLKMEKNPKKQN